MLSAFKTRAVGQCSYFHFAQPDITVHRPVAHKAIQRALKTGGFVLLEAEMSHPCKAITAKQAIQQVLRFASGNQHGQADKAQAGADKMHSAARAVAVFFEVERVKLRKPFKGFWINAARMIGRNCRRVVRSRHTYFSKF